MSDNTKPFEMQKTFGLGVLLKLIKANISGLKIVETGGKLRFNIGVDELKSAVDRAIKKHNINLKVD